MKLSLCIATYNEERFIHYPLDSAYDFVDEVIVVDGGSSDKTVEIVKKYGKKVKVFHEDNPPMFHINKQKAIERAKGEWILQLDADEALSDELKNEIAYIMQGVIVTGDGGGRAPDTRAAVEVKRTASTGGRETSDRTRHAGPVAYWVPRKNFFLTRFLEKGGIYPDYTIRFYKRGVARFPCKSVHENVTIDSSIVIPSVKSRDPNDFIGYLKNDLLHYADPDFSRYLKRWDRYTTLDAKLLVEKEEKLNFFSYFFTKPFVWFFTTYVRHAGFKDGLPGFIFALFSSIRFWPIYIKAWQMRQQNLKIKPLS